MGTNKFQKIVNGLDEISSKHSEKVAFFALKILEELQASTITPNMSNSEKELINEAKKIDKKVIFRAAYLHDIGKSFVPTPILNYPGRLSEYRFGIIKDHPEAGKEIIDAFPNLETNSLGALEHHENIDGSGYPAKKTDEEISLIAKIISVADRFEAISATRPHQRAKNISTTMDILRKQEVATNRLNGSIVEALSKNLKKLQYEDDHFISDHEHEIKNEIKNMLSMNANIELSEHTAPTKQISTNFVVVNNTNDGLSHQDTSKPFKSSDFSQIVELVDDDEKKQNLVKKYTEVVGKHFSSAYYPPEDGSPKSPFDIALDKNKKIISGYNENSAKNIPIRDQVEKYIECSMAKIDLEQQMQELSFAVKQLRKIHSEKFSDATKDHRHPNIKPELVESNVTLSDLVEKREALKPLRRYNIKNIYAENDYAQSCSSLLSQAATYEKDAIEAFLPIKDKIDAEMSSRNISYERVVTSKDTNNDTFKFECKIANADTYIVFDKDGKVIAENDKSEFSESVTKNSYTVNTDVTSLKNASMDRDKVASKFASNVNDIKRITEHLKIEEKMNSYAHKNLLEENGLQHEPRLN